MWSDRPCGVIALFDLRYHIVSHGQTIGVIVYMRSVRRGSVRSITPFLEQPHGMSRVHWPSDHITGMITPVGWTQAITSLGMITPLGWSHHWADDHISAYRACGPSASTAAQLWYAQQHGQ